MSEGEVPKHIFVRSVRVYSPEGELRGRSGLLPRYLPPLAHRAINMFLSF